MQIEVKGLEHIDDQKLFDYHKAIVEQFKSEYEDEFKYAKYDCNNVAVEFNYDLDTERFSLKHIKRFKYVHDRLVTVNRKIKKWFN